MSDITLLLGVPGTGIGIKAVMVEKGGVAEPAIKSPPEFVDVNNFRRLGNFEHNYGSLIFPGQAIQKVLDDLEGRTPLSEYRRSPVTHLVFHGAESEQVQDSVGVTFYFSAYGPSKSPIESTHL